MITEALVGAGLVLFEWVADDVSTGRVISISVHLLNTFFLLGSITLTIWWSRTGEFTHIPKLSVTFWVFLVGLLAVIVLGVSGAITALGDTLFPSESLVEGIRQDFSSTSHFLVRLRVWHPVIAIFTGTYLFLLGLLSALFYPERKARFFSISLIILYGVQLCAGLVNLLLQAPVWMQLVHLLLADLVWIGLVLLTASVFAADEKTKAQSDHVTMLKTFERHAGESL
jgi:heme A synthase